LDVEVSVVAGGVEVNVSGAMRQTNDRGDRESSARFIIGACDSASQAGIRFLTDLGDTLPHTRPHETSQCRSDLTTAKVIKLFYDWFGGP
jgi:hypothetical protein